MILKYIMQAKKIFFLRKIKYFCLLLPFFLIISCSENSDSEKLIKLWQEKGSETELTITYPIDKTIFPPEITAPIILWEDKSQANAWIVFFEDKGKILYSSDYLFSGNFGLDSADWEKLKSISIEKFINIRIIGIELKGPDDNKGKENHETGLEKIISSGYISIKTSKDSVNAPIFFRTVTLPFSFAIENLKTISWRLGDISSYQEPPKVIDSLPVCGNCHSFSIDGKTIGMDVDYGNDKGSYYINNITKNMSMEIDNIITWSDYKREDGENTFGLLSSLSPDGRWALSTVKDRSIFVRIPDLYYSQLFFPVKGIIGIYDTKTKKFSSLPGADNKAFCQSNPSWSPDGKEIIFARAPYLQVTEAEKSKEVVLPISVAKNFIEGKQEYKYDLYRIPFNDGKGGEPVPVEGASNNGMSNYFAKYSPDGKWIVFTQANNFMLLQPDAKLFIMPAAGGKPREMNCNNPNTMNSWHSWSPNGKWLVFASKAQGPYTQLYLTHIDENGMDSPPVLLENLMVKDRAANIPEFVNIKKNGIKKIVENFMDNDNYSFIRGKDKLDLGDLDGALKDINKSIAVDPKNPHSYNVRALIKVEKGDYAGAINDFSEVIKLTPDKFDAYANRATAKFNLNDFKGAIEDLNKTIQLNPKGSRGYYSRATAKYNIGDYAGAINDFTQSLKYNNKNDKVYFERAIAKMQLQQLNSACEDLKKAVELGNKEAVQYLNEYCK
ncbi:MAG: tetratricopeptide repeat protein [bacterium]